MREIIFKAKTKEGDWVYGSYIPELKRMIQRESLVHIDVIPETVFQFTGLTDKNGKKIWEGDLVKLSVEFGGRIDGWGEEEAFYHEYIGVVKYTPSIGFHLKIIKGFDVYDKEELKTFPKTKGIVQYRSEITGSIHD